MKKIYKHIMLWIASRLLDASIFFYRLGGGDMKRPAAVDDGLDARLRMDLMIYGNCYTMRAANGTIERIDPTTIRINR